jgi:hypothetical protein
MPDSPAHVPQVEHGQLMTLSEASRLSGRPLNTLRRWSKTGKLQVRFRREDGTKLVHWADLYEANREHRRWGLERRPRRMKTESGKDIVLHTQARTESWEAPRSETD